MGNCLSLRIARNILYHFVKGWLWLWSLLPLPVLHFQSSITAVLLEFVVGYRKKVILANLKASFPEKTEQELIQIRRKFYRHFCDVIFETIKQLSISPAALRRRVKHINPEVIPEMTAHGGGGIAIFGHYANWEWLGSGMGLQLPFSTVGVYKPLSNQLFDRLVRHIRTRLGNDMISMQETYRESLKRLVKPCYIAFLGDQTPARHQAMFFTDFLGRKAPIHLGIANIALKMNCGLWYFDMRKVGRGRYTVALRKIDVAPFLPNSKHSVYALTDFHVQMLEEIIRNEPAYWLWSHRRWKHQPRPGDLVWNRATKNIEVVPEA